ncbi:MAG: hypothetical protein HN348_15815 [Proteobacteria bacterium]|nr:hypothetical protein [Pseudomonadota bacterium]
MAKIPRLAGLSVVGARHLQREQCGQDAVAVANTERVATVCLADGHGDPRYEFSDEGARIAVEVAEELLMALAVDLLTADQPQQLEKHLRTHLPRRIAWEWNRRVKEHTGQTNSRSTPGPAGSVARDSSTGNLCFESASVALRPRNPDGEWTEAVMPYGTTLLGALFTPELALFVQLGDGEILRLFEGGAELVFPSDENLFGGATWSLSQPDSSTHFHICCLPNHNDTMVLLCTDGVSDSLAGEEPLAKVARWLHSRIDEEGWESVIETLPAWLQELSERGNGDDATVGIVFWG